ncbi:MAG: SUMF1/EgtB/PvdO family nonheme iron enzyme [Treponema sp.]|nr:SUMF1/EgtB/PvdO family nonheme iron enzyme [Treponema sp.]
MNLQKCLIISITVICLLCSCNQKKEKEYIIKETCREVNPRNFNMVYVEGGEFMMGDKKNAAKYPPHEVCLDSFYISDIVVTQNLYKEIMGHVVTKKENEEGDNKAVVYVTWYEAEDFCNKLSQRDGYAPCYTIDNENVNCDFSANGYRLPTEAEWEYAARGGKYSHGYEYSGSDDDKEVAWTLFCFPDDELPILPEVAKKKPNELNLFDMSGNVLEWCWDWYDPDYYKVSPKNNPRGPETWKPCYTNPDEVSLRVVRGGLYAIDSSASTVYEREQAESINNYYCVGFRIARSAVKE